jgi:hypothetical protein
VQGDVEQGFPEYDNYEAALRWGFVRKVGLVLTGSGRFTAVGPGGAGRVKGDECSAGVLYGAAWVQAEQGEGKGLLRAHMRLG